MTHYTTIEQSEKLVELGLSPESSDMHYSMVYNRAIDGGGKNLSNFPTTLKPIGTEDIPCWSLGALLEVMPKYVQINSNQTGLTIYITFVHNGIVTDSHHVKNNTFLEAAYNMVVWLLKNGYIKKGE